MRILFITATRVGDAVLSTGLLDHLLQSHPNARVTIACGSAAAGLFEAVPGLEKIIVLKKKRFSRHWLGLWANCVGHVWDMIIDLRNAPLSYLIPSRRSWHLGRDNMEAHRIIRMAAVMGLGSSPPSPHVWISAPHRERAKERLDGENSVLALGPVANWKPKTWAPDRFVEVVNRLTGKDGILPDAKVAVFGTRSEREQAEPLISSLAPEKTIDLMGELSLLEIQACLEQCRLYIGNDSGLMHMAAAAGIPTLGLFGPSREDLYAPWGRNAMSVRGELGYDEVFPEDYDYRNSDGYDLMDSLTVDRVYDAVMDLWQQVSEEKDTAG